VDDVASHLVVHLREAKAVLAEGVVVEPGEEEIFHAENGELLVAEPRVPVVADVALEAWRQARRIDLALEKHVLA